jgi:ornithine carbamoyltransferase
MLICAKLGINFTVICPQSLSPDAEIRAITAPFAKKSGAYITVSSDIADIKGADAVYTDVWVSMGEEALKAERVKLLSSYQVNDALLAKTGKPESIFLHCLPAVKGEEVTESVFEGSLSRVFDQAENRKHTIKAIMLATL